MEIEIAKQFLEDYSIDDIHIYNRQNEHFFLYDLLQEYAKILCPQAANSSVQGYREALQEVLDECKRTDISITHIVGVVSKALSKAEDRGEVNNCDGCRAGMPLVGIYHKNEQGKTHMICSKERYAPQPTNSLDELIRWVKYLEKNQRFFTLVRTDDILAKIKDLKTMYPSIKDRIEQKTPEADKIFKQAYIRELIELWYNHNEITLSRLTEILNEDAYNHYVNNGFPKPEPPNPLKTPNNEKHY
jgi:hypothetical protein